jgi:GT2 family glycosyltransferase
VDPAHESDRPAAPDRLDLAGRPLARDHRVTVAVITRDRHTSMLRTLDHLAALPERPPVIVVDNGSRNTAAVDDLRLHPVRPLVLRPGRNTGALGRNLAVSRAATPYVAFSDDDSWWEPGSLSRAADLLDEHPRAGLLAARTLVGAGREEDPLNDVLAASPLPAEPDLPGRPVLGFLGCACVVRREAFLDAGGYHPVLFFGAEETLLAYDLAAAGWGVAHTPDLIARHCPDEGGERTGRKALVRRNEVLTRWMRRPLPDAVAATVRLTRDAVLDGPGARTAARGVAKRLPAALRARRPLPPAVERAARTLESRPPRRGVPQ